MRENGEPIRAIATSYVWSRPWADKPEFQQLRSAVLKRIDGLTFDFKSLDPDTCLGHCRIAIRTPDEEEVAFVERLIDRPSLRHSVAVDLVTTDFDLEEIASKVEMSDGSAVDEIAKISSAKHFVCFEVERALNGVLTLWNVCYFGCLNSEITISKVGEDFLSKVSGSDSRLLWAYNDGELIALSPKPRMHPEHAIRWSRDCEGYWTGTARTKIQRGMACLTRIFSNTYSMKSDPYTTLVWSLAGLEALFCDSSSAISYQIRRRAPLIVADFDFSDLDKAISKGYDFRSRLFHGDVKIRSTFAENDELASD